MLCKKLIELRTTKPVDKWYISGKQVEVFWCIFGAAGFVAIHIVSDDMIRKAELAMIFLLCLCVSAVDFAIRKIPNSLLLALIVSKIAFLILNFSTKELKQSVLGFAVACVVFTIPSLLKIPVGAGDIKFAAVTGLYLGLYGFLQAMIIMAIAIGLYGIYIIIRKLGNLKTKTAMGPYLALGLLLTLVFPII